VASLELIASLEFAGKLCKMSRGLTRTLDFYISAPEGSMIGKVSHPIGIGEHTQSA